MSGLPVYFLTYVSSATESFTGGQLRDLLVSCERNNRRDSITGMLLYKDGNFMQVLEGSESDVHATHLRIGKDPRHSGLITLLKGSQNERQFAHWSMGFRDLGAATLMPAGYSEFLNSPLAGNEFLANPSRAQKLLMVFKNSR